MKTYLGIMNRIKAYLVIGLTATQCHSLITRHGYVGARSGFE
jgi:hypothetical protein